jgi:hypothetical protein
MTQFARLTPSAADYDSTIIGALELSEKKWVLAVQLPGVKRHSRRALALRAMPIAAAIIGDDFVGAVFAARDMPAEGCRAAALDRRHYLQLAEAHVAGVRHAGPWSRKISATSRTGRPMTAGVYAGGLLPPDFSGIRRSSGLMTSLMVLVATRV